MKTKKRIKKIEKSIEDLSNRLKVFECCCSSSEEIIEPTEEPTDESK